MGDTKDVRRKAVSFLFISGLSGVTQSQYGSSGIHLPKGRAIEVEFGEIIPQGHLPPRFGSCCMSRLGWFAIETKVVSFYNQETGLGRRVRRTGDRSFRHCNTVKPVQQCPFLQLLLHRKMHAEMGFCLRSTVPTISAVPATQSRRCSETKRLPPGLQYVQYKPAISNAVICTR